MKLQSRDMSVVRPNEDVGSSVHISKFVLVYIANQPSKQPTLLHQTFGSIHQQQRPALGSSERGRIVLLVCGNKKEACFWCKKGCRGSIWKSELLLVRRVRCCRHRCCLEIKKDRKRVYSCLFATHSRSVYRELLFKYQLSCNLAWNCGCKCSAVSFVRQLESRRAEIFALISAACFVNGFLSREREDETNSLECLAHIFAQLAAVTDSTFRLARVQSSCQVRGDAI